MKVKRYIRTGLLAALLMEWGCLLTACGDQSEMEPARPEEEAGQPLHVAALTRAGGEDDDPMRGKIIQLFLWKDGAVDQSGQVQYPGRGVSTGGGGLGTGSMLTVKPGADYQVFGFMPASVATGSSSVSVSGSTVTMTINGLPTLSREDLCVVTGVKTGADASATVVPGVFDYHAPENTASGYSVSLLADHLYAGVTFRYVIDATYNALRHIKLKKVVLKSTNVSEVNLTATLNMNTTGANPLATPSIPASTGEAVLDLFTSDEGEQLQVADADAIEMTCYFPANMASTLSLVNTYDVYDAQNNLIRPDEEAVNTLSDALSGAQHGLKKIVKLTVNPSYIYVLSDGDVRFVIN